MGSTCSTLCPPSSSSSETFTLELRSSKTSNRIHINDLPDLCLRIMFANLSLSDLLQIGRVCHYWRRLQLSIGATKRDISIIGDGNPVRALAFEFSHLDFKNLEPNQLRIKYESNINFSREIIDIFPNIKSAHIVMNRSVKSLNLVPAQNCANYCDSIVNQFEWILASWAPKLDSLYLDVHLMDNQQESSLIQLINRINTFPTLKSLTLYLNIQISKKITDWLILTRLTEFNLDLYGFQATQLEGLPIDSLIKFRGENLTKIRLGNVTFENVRNDFLKLVQDQPDLCKKIVNFPALEFDHTKMPDFSLSDFCERFCNLESISIDLNLNLVTIYKFVQSMEKLEKLVHLKICAFLKTDSENQEQEQEQAQIPNYQIAQLPSVQILTLTCSLNSHEDLNSIKWNRLFPNLKTVQLDEIGNDCTICKIGDSNQIDSRFTMIKKVKDCTKIKLQAWKCCTNLSSIYYNSTEWTLDDL